MNTKRILKSALCLVVVCAMMLCMCSCAAWKKTFAKPHEYMAYIEQEAIAAGVESFVDYYDKELAYYGKNANTAVKSEMQISLGDGLAQMLQLMLGMDLTWVNDVTIKVDGNKNGNLFDLFVGLVLGDDTLISVNTILNTEDDNAYIQIPQFSEKYLSYDFKEMLGEDGDVLSLNATAEIVEKLPEGKVLGDLINKYVGIIFDNIKEAEKTKGTLDANGKSEECTILEAELTYSEFCELVKTVIRELQKDTLIEELITTGVDIVNEFEGAAEGEKLNATTVYADFIKGTNEMLEDIDAESDIDPDEVVLVWTDYVNGDSEIIGRKLYLYETIEFFYGKASEKEAYGEEFYVKEYCKYDGESEEYGEWSELISISGEGSVKNNILSGEYDVYAEGEFILNFTVSDIDVKAAQKGQFKGSIEVFPSAELFASDGEGSVISSLASSLSFGMDYDYSESKQEIKIFINNLGSEFLSVTLKSETVKSDVISVPTDSDVQETDTWMANADFEAFLEGLRNSDLPDDIVAMIEQLFAY